MKRVQGLESVIKFQKSRAFSQNRDQFFIFAGGVDLNRPAAHRAVFDIGLFLDGWVDEKCNLLKTPGALRFGFDLMGCHGVEISLLLFIVSSFQVV